MSKKGVVGSKGNMVFVILSVVNIKLIMIKISCIEKILF